MIIENRTIMVKSWPENWKYEQSGAKANTIRQVSDYEWDTFDLIAHKGLLYTELTLITKIKVINTETLEEFERTLTNVTYWYTAGIRILILSWNPAEGNETN